MARPRYPSDDRRLRPHAKVHLTIRHHPSYVEVFSDPELRGIVVGLWVVAVEHQAARTDDTVTLSDGDLRWITGREQRRHALCALRAACLRMGYATSTHAAHVVVKVRNLQRKQGLAPQLRGGDSATPSASELRVTSTDITPSTPQTPRSDGPLFEPDPKPNGGGSSPDLQPARGGPPAPPEPDEVAAFEAVDLLRSAIVESIPGQRTPKPESTGERAWVKALRQLRKDGARVSVPARSGAFDGGWDWPEILDVIRWLPTHERGEFRWGKVVLSAAALRKHFPRLLDEMRLASAAGKPPPYQPPPEPRDRDLDARRAALRRLRERAGDPRALISIAEIEAEMERAATA